MEVSGDIWRRETDHELALRTWISDLTTLKTRKRGGGGSEEMEEGGW